MDQIMLKLEDNPNGGQVALKNIKAFGCSNLTITNLRSDIATLQFQITLEIPRITVRAQFEVSGVLMSFNASGSGDYWGEYGEWA